MSQNRVTRVDPYCLVATFALVLYAQWNTGVAADDFTFSRPVLSGSLTDFWSRLFVSRPFMKATHGAPYFFLGDQWWAYGPLKAAYHSFVIYAAGRFFGLFFEPWRAWLGSLLLLLSPLHDGATLWFAGQYLMVSMGCYLLAYVRADARRDATALALAIGGSFSSYGSSPIAVGLALMFLLQKRWRAAVLMIGPNAVYAAYYVYTSTALNLGTARLPQDFGVSTFARSFAAQLGSFPDAAVGPSAWLKTAFGLSALSVFSFLVALAFSAWLWRVSQQQAVSSTLPKHSPILLAGCSAVALGAFGIFALTSSYPQVAFSLGNRVMIFGNLFLVALALMFLRPRVLTVFTALTVTAFLGVSDHWKSWNKTLTSSAEDIRALELPLDFDGTLFVRGLQYSQLGSVAHIDHFTTSYIVRDFFAIARPGRTQVRAASFNSRLRLEPDYLVDAKYGERSKIGNSILLYDADRKTLARVARNEIGPLLRAEPVELRHWTQLLGPGIVRDMILILMPQLRYAYGG